MNDSLLQFLMQFVTAERLRRFDEVLSRRTRHLTLVLENIHHAHNASACLRTCDCFGIQDVHIVESQNSFRPNREIAMGASQWLTIHRYTTNNKRSDNSANHAATADCINQLRRGGYRIMATSPRQDSTALSDTAVDSKTAVFFGAEQMGVSDFALSQADELVHLPMFGFTESFNVSVSVALVLQHFVTRLHLSAVNWELPETEKRDLLNDWVRQTLGPKLAPLCRRFEADQPD